MGAYVVAEDLDRSAVFYERLFGHAPQVRTAGMVGFDVAGGFYAIVSKAVYAPGAVRGGNVAPYLKVADIDAWFRHVEAVAPDGLVTKAVLREGPFALIKFADPDGNVVEMYSVTPPPAK
jgi:predicted enzyme related to lactoylglutathione lyase